VLRIRHNPARRLPEQHVGFLIGNTARVLHVGDADPEADNFALLRSLPTVDIALLPFWYVLGEANRRFVAESIHPARIVAMHLPPDDASATAAALAAAGIRASLPRNPGEPIALER
jgi:L-ascorbate metabolism protein UlaG (beta-lactamase superfamily)